MEIKDLLLQETGLITDEVLTEAGEGVQVGVSTIHPDDIAKISAYNANCIGENLKI